MQNETLSRVSDTELVAALTRLAMVERDATVTLIRYLAEFDRRRLYRGLGFSSMFGYCCEVLRLSEHESYNRIQAARTARKYPEVLTLLSSGSIKLTTIRLLAPHLTPENHREVLEESSEKGKREIEELLARRLPQPVVPSSVRKLPMAVARTGARTRPARLSSRVPARRRPRRRPWPPRSASAGSRHIPAEVRRAVWKRDREQCAFVSPGGRRCQERGALEFHHVRPYGAGGEATVENIQLRCRSHNQYESELFYGISRGGYDVARECYENSFQERVRTHGGELRHEPVR